MCVIYHTLSQSLDNNCCNNGLFNLENFVHDFCGCQFSTETSDIYLVIPSDFEW